MQENLGASRRNTHAAIGPAIAQASYEVGPEFPAPFFEVDTENTRFFRPSVNEGRHMFDLTGCVLNILKKARRIDRASRPDTCADSERFFSYRRATHRREPDYGRGLSIISLGD